LDKPSTYSLLRYLQASLLCTVLFPASLYAEEPSPQPKADDGLCPAEFIASQPKPIEGDKSDKRVYISADKAHVDSESVTYFEGTVKARQADRILEAEKVRYDRNTEQIDAEGKITYATSGMKVTGESAKFNLENNQGEVKNAQYFTGSVNGRGEAEVISIKSKHRVELDSASYTTCPPGDEAWALRANAIKLDNEKRQGTASNVVLEVANIPVFYLPYIRFPIGEERMSGLLYPGLGQSDRHGTSFSLPYYWNIAPHFDATITPTNMTKRGISLETELRYLTENNQGIFDATYLPSDKAFNNEDRRQLVWNHTGSPALGWSTLIDYKEVSDTNYLDDFAGSLATSSVTHLNQEGKLSYNHPHFLFQARVQNHQNISGEEPYKREPQLNLDSRFTNQDNQFNYDINTEMVRFDHTEESRVIGQRIYLKPFISYPFQSEPGFFIPKLSLHHLQYDLDRLPAATDDDDPNVTIPVFSADMGIFLERDFTFGETELLQTLEPRLFYLYAEEKDQSSLPVFDTALTTFGESLLFSENRFSGRDRIGDANQLTTALSTRFYRSDTGAEVLNATLGQIIYFEDRDVILPGGSVETTDRSSYIGLLSFTPNRRLKFIGDLQWDPETKHTEVGNYRVSYTTEKGQVINYDYRFRRNEIRTQGVSFAWRFNPAWQVFGGHQYDLENDHRLENFLGVRYDNCCWAVRLVAHEQFDTLVNGSARFDNAVFLELVLKGLSSLGSRKEIDTLVENGILGYSE